MLRRESLLEILWGLRHSRPEPKLLQEIWAELAQSLTLDKIFRLFRKWKPYRLSSKAFRTLFHQIPGRDFVRQVVDEAEKGSREAFRLLYSAKLRSSLAWALSAAPNGPEIMKELDFFVVRPTDDIPEALSASSEVSLLFGLTTTQSLKGLLDF